jgi:DDE family transposase
MADSSVLSPEEAREELAQRFAVFLAPLLARLRPGMDPRLLRSVREALLAILVHPRPRQTLMLTTFAEQSERRSPRLIHTVKRFYRLLHHPSFQAQRVRDWLLARGTQGWGDANDELVLIDGSELIKPYAKHMEYLSRVPNPLHQLGGPRTMPGYWLLAAVRTTLRKGMAQLVDWQLWSTVEPDFGSQNRVERQFFQRLVARVEQHAVLVMDRGLGRFTLLGQLAALGARFVVRVSIQRDFAVDEEGMIHLRLLPYRLPLVYERVVFDPFQKQEVLARYGYRRVHRKEIDADLTLVVQWLGDLEEPWLLLTNDPVHGEADAWRIVQIYWRRMEIEQTFRFLKSEVGLDSFRVREFAAIHRMVALGMVMYAFLVSLWEGGGPLVSFLCHLTRWLGLSHEKETVYKLRWGINRLLTCLPPGYG